MPFGLKNAPVTFQRMMDKILKEHIGEFVTVYLDDIIIYSENFNKHIEHIKKVLEKLEENNLIVKLKKCNFGNRKIEYLGHEIGKNRIKPNEHKIKRIRDMKRPKNAKGIRSFVMLCSYYRRFIKDFSKIAKPMMKLVKKNIPFEWKDE
jgi:hypothetical protein